MRGAIPPLPQYAFMAWCSVKKGTGRTLPLPFIMTFYHWRQIKYEIILNRGLEEYSCIPDSNFMSPKYEAQVVDTG
jgi:hypothetical protein